MECGGYKLNLRWKTFQKSTFDWGNKLPDGAAEDGEKRTSKGDQSAKGAPKSYDSKPSKSSKVTPEPEGEPSFQTSFSSPNEHLVLASAADGRT